MKIWELKRIIKNLDDDMEISVQVETEDYDVINCKILGYNTYDGDLVLEAGE